MIETDQHRLNEIKTLTKLCENTNYEFKQTEKFCRYDAEIYDITDHELKAIVEIKNRNIKSTSFKDWFISYKKWDYGKRIAKQKKCKIILVAGLIDGLFYIDITNKKIGNGITKCYNEQLQDEMIYIPMSLLKRKL